MRLFNEKAEKLANSRFLDSVQKGRQTTISMGDDQPLTVERKGPDAEATNAMLLTFRFFFNKRDGISLSPQRAGSLDIRRIVGMSLGEGG
jgi:hypothetical protein